MDRSFPPSSSHSGPGLPASKERRKGGRILSPGRGEGRYPICDSPYGRRRAFSRLFDKAFFNRQKQGMDRKSDKALI
ncbi:unnamed protein product [Dovyalis caffra]|uniref:Uncharacterized protein n=1 Tax=Dovyalis caffra TaxID=77055 RepID=A0AAV1R6G3_9ROSI|nr:unnamed protein product [Dovyalis caffra]